MHIGFVLIMLILLGVGSFFAICVSIENCNTKLIKIFGIIIASVLLSSILIITAAEWTHGNSITEVVEYPLYFTEDIPHIVTDNGIQQLSDIEEELPYMKVDENDTLVRTKYAKVWIYGFMYYSQDDDWKIKKVESK